MKQILGKHSFFRAFICATGWESDTNGIFPGRSTQMRNDKTGRRAINATGFMPETARVPWVKQYRSTSRQTFR